jgi:hypothetical protein
VITLLKPMLCTHLLAFLDTVDVVNDVVTLDGSIALLSASLDAFIRVSTVSYSMLYIVSLYNYFMGEL